MWLCSRDTDENILHFSLLTKKNELHAHEKLAPSKLVSTLPMKRGVKLSARKRSLFIPKMTPNIENEF